MSIESQRLRNMIRTLRQDFRDLPHILNPEGRKLCYDCDHFDYTTCKCNVRRTYVITPTKAEHCRTSSFKEDSN